jgi:DNA-binding IscR family transcriptional regulator
MRPIPGQVRGSALKVLLIILESADQGHLVTTREVARALGWRSPYYAQQCLAILEREGLIVREHGKGGGRTIRPACVARFYREYLP